MHITENWNNKAKKMYCVAAECKWNKNTHKYDKPRIPIGKLEGDPPSFVPNKYFANLLNTKPSNRGEQEKLIIATAVKKYGNGILKNQTGILGLSNTSHIKTVKLSLIGPQMVFGAITKRCQLDKILLKSFGEDTAKNILSLVWYLVSEDSALTYNNPWLDLYESPRGQPFSNQDLINLLDNMETSEIMTFYKEWFANLQTTKEKVLCDLTSISWSGKSADFTPWEHNRNTEHKKLNFAMVYERGTGMPLLAWALDESILDTQKLQNTLQFINKLNLKVSYLIMDREFLSEENINYMFKNGYSFLQALPVNTLWIQDIIDASRKKRLNPHSVIKEGNRTYYGSTTICNFVVNQKMTKNGYTEQIDIDITNEDNIKTYRSSEKGAKVVFKHNLFVHILYCQDLVIKKFD